MNRCRHCNAYLGPDEDFCASCGLCRHPSTATPPAETSMIIYAAVMDEETCPSCRGQEGRSAIDLQRLMPVPNPRCTSLLGCRCFHIYQPK